MYLTYQNHVSDIFFILQTVTSKGLKANEWVQHVSQVLGGKGGGKPESAQATGTNANAVNEAINLAKTFAEMKLS